MHFIVATLGQDRDHFTLHIYASLAEQERKLISERVWRLHPDYTGKQVVKALGLGPCVCA